MSRQSASDVQTEPWVAELEDRLVQFRQLQRKRRVNRLLRALLFIGLLSWMGWKLGQTWWILFIVGGGSAGEAVRASRRSVSGALSVAAGDVRCINFLAKAAHVDDGDTRKLARSSLKEMLPRLRASDANLISDEGMAALCRLLTWRRLDMKLAIAVMDAFQQVGDQRCIAAVRGMLAPPRPARRILRWIDIRFGAGVQRHLAQVTDAAHECLPFLEQRAELRRQAAMLLQPASAPPDIDPGSLLRPASAPPAIPESQLLRPAAQGEGPDGGGVGG